MKAKKGQILILVLILMAVGLIIMSPLLDYLNTSYNIYASKLNDAKAYYTVDAMMGKVFSDIWAGENVYLLNTEQPTRYNNKSSSGWLNGFNVSTSINDSIAQPPPPPSGDDSEWTFMDPGCAFGLNSLAYGATYTFNASLTTGTNVTVNWYFRDAKAVGCNYYCIGRMWITPASDPGTTLCGSSTTDLTNGASTAFQKQLVWTVPQNGSAIYSFKFQNRAVRGQGGGCPNITRSMSQMYVKPTFSGIGDPLYTWIRVGNTSSGSNYQDYTITTTATLASTNTTVASVTACVRQAPGPSKWWEEQTLSVVSWTITYY